VRSAIIYNLYPKNHWKELTASLLGNVNHDSIFVCVALDRFDLIFRKKRILTFLQSIPKVSGIFFVENSRNLGEVVGFNELRYRIEELNFGIVTYLHSKGVTKPHNKNIRDWVDLMKYFLIDRHADCISAFQKGYALYGVNLGIYDRQQERYGPYKFSDFHYSGNFVSVNLEELRDQFFKTPCDQDYFGVEGFWGKLTNVEKAFCAHLSSKTITSHYLEPYPIIHYKNDAPGN